MNSEPFYGWFFTLETLNDDFHVDGDGEKTWEPVEYQGTEREAQREGQRRADLWEINASEMAIRMILERRGMRGMQHDEKNTSS